MINRKKCQEQKDIKEFDCPTNSNCLQKEARDSQGRLVMLKLIPLNDLGKADAYTEYTQYNDDGTVEKEVVWYKKKASV